MAGIKDKLTAAFPWVEPVLDYFDWRKRLVALVAAAGIAVWSFVKDLPWPVIVTLALGVLVFMAYAMVFPAFVRLVHVGINPRPNNSIWRHKKQFALFQVAYLLADREPIRDPAGIGGDALAWFEVLREAVKDGELKYAPGPFDAQNTFVGEGYRPHMDTLIDAPELKKFCETRGRRPEFLNW